MPHEIIFVVTA